MPQIGKHRVSVERYQRLVIGRRVISKKEGPFFFRLWRSRTTPWEGGQFVSEVGGGPEAFDVGQQEYGEGLKREAKGLKERVLFSQKDLKKEKIKGRRSVGEQGIRVRTARPKQPEHGTLVRCKTRS